MVAASTGTAAFTIFNFDGAALEVLPKLSLGPTRGGLRSGGLRSSAAGK